MIDPRHLAFDIDGVVANTMQLFIDIGKEVYGIHHIRYEQMTAYDLQQCLDIEPETIQAIVNRITEGDYPCKLGPIQGAPEVLKRLGALGPIRMVTARPHLGPIKEWVAGLLGRDHGVVKMTATGSFDAKPDFLRSQNITHFVDDRIDTCHLLQAHDITPILFAQPWNRQSHPFLEVDGWRQMALLIDWPGAEHMRQTG
jgi:uncharacterized protein